MRATGYINPWLFFYNKEKRVIEHDTYFDEFDELDEYEAYADEFDPLRTDRRARRKRNPKAHHRPKKTEREIIAEIADATGIEGEFTTTYTPGRFEAEWLLDSVRFFYEQEQIRDILYQVKGGKEASVYCCEAHSVMEMDLLAVKVYRPRKFRNLRNDAMYRQGRKLLATDGRPIKDTDDRISRAVRKKTDFGVQVLHTSWLMHEFNAMRRLFQLGAAVPEPIASSENAILMTYCGDRDGAAPTLNSIRLEPPAARRLFQTVLDNIDLMLQNNLIHGDLSAYNILYWDGDITLIDFPQVVDSQGNSDAYFILQRDITRVCEYFLQQGIDCNPDAITTDFWRRYVEMDPQDKAADMSRLDFVDWTTFEDEVDGDAR
jgi:RIO kinase 1